MTKRELLELADKYEKGNCSKKETALLHEFCNNLQFKNLITNLNLDEASQIKINLLKRILQTIKLEKSNKKSIFKLYQIKAVAAILIGVLFSSSIYFLINNQDKNEIPENAITLKLEDGTIKEVKENGVNAFLNKKGLVIGKQEGNRLLYKEEQEQPLEKLSYNTLTVPYGKRFEIELSDGTIAYLNSGSALKYPTQFIKNTKRQIFVTGEVFLNVAKDALCPFVVNANHLNITVLGTKFNVNAYPEDSTSEVVLVEGSVALQVNNNQASTSNVILKPGYKAICNKNDDKIYVKEVVTDVYTSWITGELVFRNMTFENIIKKLERHYNLQIINKTTNINKTVFNASFGDESIEVILKSLKDNYGIAYSINDNVIIINN